MVVSGGLVNKAKTALLDPASVPPASAATTDGGDLASRPMETPEKKYMQDIMALQAALDGSASPDKTALPAVAPQKTEGAFPKAAEVSGSMLTEEQRQKIASNRERARVLAAQRAANPVASN